MVTHGTGGDVRWSISDESEPPAGRVLLTASINLRPSILQEDDGTFVELVGDAWRQYTPEAVHAAVLARDAWKRRQP